MYVALRKERYIDGLPTYINTCVMSSQVQIPVQTIGSEDSVSRHFNVEEVEKRQIAI